MYESTRDSGNAASAKPHGYPAQGRRLPSKVPCAIGLVLVLGVTAPLANAVEFEELRDQLDQLIKTQLGIEPVDEKIASRKTDLLNLLVNDDRVSSASKLTKELVLQVVHDNFVRYRTTVSEGGSLADYYTERLLRAPSPKDVSSFLQLLLPYVKDARLCSGDPLSDVGATCAFQFVPEASSSVVNVVGRLSDTAAPLKEEFTGWRAAPRGSELHRVLSGCARDDQACRDAALPLITSKFVPMRARAMPTDYWGDEWGSEQGSRETGYQGTRITLDYFLGFYSKYRCGLGGPYLFSCTVWGEFYAAFDAKYLIASSDTVMAVVPFILVCPTTCFWGAIVGAVGDMVNDKWLGGGSSFDPASYTLWATNSQAGQLRAGGSYAVHTARGSCGVLPMPYQTRPSYQAIKESEDLNKHSERFDAKFQTHYQVPPLDPTVPVLSTNMDPTPSRANASLPEPTCNPLPIRIDFTWTYDFLMVRAWEPNIMFSGTDNYNPTHYCGADQIWTWHGAPYGGSFGLGQFDFTAAFAGGHVPYLVSAP